MNLAECAASRADASGRGGGVCGRNLAQQLAGWQASINQSSLFRTDESRPNGVGEPKKGKFSRERPPNGARSTSSRGPCCLRSGRRTPRVASLAHPQISMSSPHQPPPATIIPADIRRSRSCAIDLAEIGDWRLGTAGDGQWHEVRLASLLLDPGSRSGILLCLVVAR